MGYRKRIYYTDTQKAEMWDRWQKGESLHAIARSFDRHHTSVRGILAATGGIRPRERRRSRHGTIEFYLLQLEDSCQDIFTDN